MTLGERLKAARQGKGMTLRQVEKETGISNGYLSLVESDDVKQVSPHHLHKLAEVYDLDYAELMQLAGYVVPAPALSASAARRGRGTAVLGRAASVPTASRASTVRGVRSANSVAGRHVTPRPSANDLTPDERVQVDNFISFLRSRRGTRGSSGSPGPGAS